MSKRSPASLAAVDARTDERSQREAAILEALDGVVDPCSRAARVPLSVIEMGLIRDWTLAATGEVRVTISPTGPSCILIGSIIKGIKERIGTVVGVKSVEVEIDGETVWSPDLMTAGAQHKLAERQNRSMAEVPVRPRQWQTTKGGV